jgi:hypothetical protein
MKKFLLNILLFVIIGIIILFVIGRYLDFHYKKYNNKHIDHKANWVFKKSGENLDYAVLGSSLAFNIIDINTIDSIGNLEGINLGSGGAAFSQNYVMLEKYLRQNKIANLILALDKFSLSSRQSFSYPFSDYAFLPDMQDPIMEDAFKKETPISKFIFWKYIPATKYMEFNYKYPFYKNFVLGKNENYSTMEKYRGSSLLKTNKSQLVLQPETKEYKTVASKWLPDTIDLYYLDKIISLCKEHEIRIFTYAAPCTKLLYESRHYAKINLKIQQLSIEKGIIWKDYMLTDLSNNQNMFVDVTHLNANGAKIFSQKLITDLLKLGFRTSINKD